MRQDMYRSVVNIRTVPLCCSFVVVDQAAITPMTAGMSSEGVGRGALLHSSHVGGII